jgi:dephospho-CoA kinase
MADRTPLRIGLTGGIGSGKSSVASLLAGHGATIVDTDAIARRLSSAGGAAIEPIAQQFGRDFIGTDGALDRARMRSLAFGEPQARQQLEAILHPLIGIEVQREAEASRASVIVFDVPLLVESARWRDRVDRVLLVDCREAVQVERVVARSAWTPEAVRAVIAQQASRAQRRAAADAVLFNDGVTLEELAAAVLALWNHWSLAQRPRGETNG